MDLATYMEKHGLTDDALGKKISRSRVSVSRYRRKLELPSTDVVKQLVELSGGAMTADDLLGIETAAGAQP
jgi:ParB-like chromosome segregation protein Spo0J